MPRPFTELTKMNMLDIHFSMYKMLELGNFLELHNMPELFANYTETVYDKNNYAGTIQYKRPADNAMVAVNVINESGNCVVSVTGLDDKTRDFITSIVNDYLKRYGFL